VRHRTCRERDSIVAKRSAWAFLSGRHPDRSTGTGLIEHLARDAEPRATASVGGRQRAPVE
jgi:hypothetical protein